MERTILALLAVCLFSARGEVLVATNATWEATLADPTSPMSALVRKLGIAPLVHAWRWRCGVGPRGNHTDGVATTKFFVDSHQRLDLIAARGDGRLLLDGETLDAESLRARLRSAKESSDEVVCLVAADRAVAHGRVIWLIDLIRSEGISKFALNIDKAEMVPSDPATRGEGRGVLPGDE